MSFLTQNPVFYCCVLIAPVCKKALKSGAHEFQYGLESRSKIDEKSFQNAFEMRLFSLWFLASLLTPILDRFWNDFGSKKVSIKRLLVYFGGGASLAALGAWLVPQAVF